MPPQSRPTADYYKTLGVKPSASAAEIKKAYRKLAIRHHPDKQKPNKVDRATKKLAAINQAYTVLGDESQRRMYDMSYMAANSAMHGFAAAHNCRLQAFFLGRCGPPLFGHAPIVPSVRGELGLQLAVRGGRPALVFLHLSSARCERAAQEVAAAARRLRGAVGVVALDAASPLAMRLTGGSADVPLALMLHGRQMRPVAARLEADALVSEGLEALGPAAMLRPICSVAELKQLLRLQALPVGVAVALRSLPHTEREAMRATCAARGVPCGRLTSPGSRCPAAAHLQCEGSDVALLRRTGKPRRCWSAPSPPAGPSKAADHVDAHAADALAAALRAHATRERHGAFGAPPRLWAEALWRSAPARLAADLGVAALASPCAKLVEQHGAVASAAVAAAAALPMLLRWRDWQRAASWRRKTGERGRGRRVR